MYIKKSIFALFIICLCISPCFGTVEDVKQIIIKQANSMSVDPALMLSLAYAESGFKQDVKASCGTVGVFQLLPVTAKKMGLNAYDLNDNIKGGILYYKSMYNTFGSRELALAAYNSGAGAVKKCNCVPHHAKHFVNKVITGTKRYK